MQSYPGQEHIAGTQKVPSVLYYDSEGNVMAACAEALLSETIEKAEDEDWQKVEWYALLPNLCQMNSFKPDSKV